MQYVDKEKFSETLVDKLCSRFKNNASKINIIFIYLKLIKSYIIQVIV